MSNRMGQQWSKDESRALFEAVALNQHTFAWIAQKLGRTEQSCKVRWTVMMKRAKRAQRQSGVDRPAQPELDSCPIPRGRRRGRPRRVHIPDSMDEKIKELMR